MPGRADPLGIQGATPYDNGVAQLGILDKESDRIRPTVYACDLDALSDQSRFLREKFEKLELEL